MHALKFHGARLQRCQHGVRICPPKEQCRAAIGAELTRRRDHPDLQTGPQQRPFGLDRPLCGMEEQNRLFFLCHNTPNARPGSRIPGWPRHRHMHWSSARWPAARSPVQRFPATSRPDRRPNVSASSSGEIWRHSSIVHVCLTSPPARLFPRPRSLRPLVQWRAPPRARCPLDPLCSDSSS